MAKIRPFSAIRPVPELASRVVALPYDVYNRREAREEAMREPLSFLCIDRPETQFEEGMDLYSPAVYQKAHDMLWEQVERGIYLREEKPCYYLYELTMNGRIQDGIVACASIDDYTNGVIKKHENTREEKEQDRIRHVDTCNAQTGPIFLAYRSRERLKDVIARCKEREALYDFVAMDGIRHRAFVFAQDEMEVISREFASMEEIYIADGHHRAASAVKVGWKRRTEHPNYTGEEEFNYFLSVFFADEQLQIMDYNRVVKDLHGHTTESFLEEVSRRFAVTASQKEAISPSKKGEFTMFLEGKWYVCQMREEAPSDPVEGLDVSILQKDLLEPVLGIEDPRVDTRIDFVGGIRGLGELERRVQTDCKVAFAMYPTSIQELFSVADAGLLMPPKSTWFEPKLRSGMFLHEI